MLYETVLDTNDTNKYRLNTLGAMLLKYGLLEDVDVEIQSTTHLKDLEWKDL